MTGEPKTDEIAAEGTLDEGAGPRSAEPKSRRIDPVALVAGLLFIAIGLAALTDRFWADLDPVLVVGGTVIAVGVAMIVGTVLRHSRRDESPNGEPGRDG